MLIRCKLFRPSGTYVELGKGKGKRAYRFKPRESEGLKGPELDRVMNDPDLEHVVDVTDKEDIATFLAIPEGYEIHDSVVETPAAKAAVKKAATPKAVGKNGGKTAAEKGGYSNLKKPDLIKRIVGHPNFTGKAPHGTTPTAKLIEQLEALDAEAKQPA
jgi:hypothetical protein